MKSYILQIKLLTILVFMLNGCGGGSGGGKVETTVPNFTSSSTVYVRENQVNVVVVHAEDNTAVTYSIEGGIDKSFFSIENDSGKLTFKTAPDFESPSDNNGDNHYHITVQATDTSNNQAQQQITVIVTDIDEIPPVFISESSITMKENHVFPVTVQANDDSSVTYKVSGGDDSSNFMIDSHSGKLRFMTAPDFEKPVDSDTNNTYEVNISATDDADNQAIQQISITVSDIDETSSDDTDDDMIPDNIEILIDSNLSDGDINNNGEVDGLDTEGNYGDTFFDKQWHIRSLGTATNDSGVETILGNDLNITKLYHHYMGYNHGNNIIVQVVDTGVDADHEDLADNMDLSRSYNGSTVGDPSGSHTHGTMVAGIMAARAFNGKGVRGIAPFAKIAGSNWLESQTIAGLEKVWLSGAGANEIAVTNNSWGSFFNTDTFYEDIMEQGTATLRDQKGRIYVFAAGNDREKQGNANLQYYLNNRYAIAVAALKHDNTHADYSSPGSNILVSGYSGNYYQDSPTIGTTTIMGASSHTGDIDSKTTWEEDTQENYTFIMNGTSSASPTVAASIALVLEACPDLTWRDIKYLIAKHAQKIDTDNSTWIKNDANLWYSTDYGFGLINAQGMIDECVSPEYTNLSDEQNISVTKTFNTVIPDDQSTLSFDINLTKDITVEWVEVTIDNDNRYASDYRVELKSPKETKITIMPDSTGAKENWMDGGFRLSCASMLNEKSKGTWTIDITDEVDRDQGTLKTIQLKIYGH